MKLNVGLNEFKKIYHQKKNQVLYYKIKSKSSFEIENLINNFLGDRNSFIFESVEKGKIKVDTQFLAKNQIKYGSSIKREFLQLYLVGKK